MAGAIACSGGNGSDNGGGGGAVGRIRINSPETLDLSFILSPSWDSAAFSTGPLQTNPLD